jgi:hypothetical protein
MRALSGLIGLGLLIGFAGGQPPAADKKNGPIKEPAKKEAGKEVKPAKGSLEEAIATALKSNPDVRVAEAEVQLAQAKLAQAKLTVAQKVTAAHLAVERAKADEKFAEATFNRISQLHTARTVPKEELDNARAKLDAAKAAVAKAEADYNVALGVMPNQNLAVWESASLSVAFSPDGGTLYSLAADGSVRAHLVAGNAINMSPGKIALDYTAAVEVPPAGSVTDKLRTALDKQVTVQKAVMNVESLLAQINKDAGLGLTFRVLIPRTAYSNLALEASTMPFGALVQMIEDEFAETGVRFVMRDYGILVTDAKTLPHGAMTVHEFSRQMKADRAKEKAEPKK